MKDTEIKNLIAKEYERQTNFLELIASENVVSTDILEAAGSILTNKYAEGYPGRRYYGGCEYVDQIEQLAIDRACALFGAKFANVQPHSGSQANAAAYHALLPQGGKILALALNDGGHLTHGSPVSFSSRFYEFVFFPLDNEGRINIKNIEEAILTEKPDALLIGYSSYPLHTKFAPIAELCKKHNLPWLVDMAHFAGLVAGGAHDNPVPHATIVTSTTHKTLRGPRGGLILTDDENLIKKINSATFPFYQGGPLEHIIAAKAICFKEAATEQFKKYTTRIVENTHACATRFAELGCVVSPTETHLFVLNTKKSFGKTGIVAQKLLDECNITTNKNMLPNDDEKPSITSGIRIGFPAVTTRGCTVKMAKQIADIIYEVLSDKIDIGTAKQRTLELVAKLKPIPSL